MKADHLFLLYTLHNCRGLNGAEEFSLL